MYICVYLYISRCLRQPRHRALAGRRRNRVKEHILNRNVEVFWRPADSKDHTEYDELLRSRGNEHILNFIIEHLSYNIFRILFT